jgi:hypothetical protein
MIKQKIPYGKYRPFVSSAPDQGHALSILVRLDWGIVIVMALAAHHMTLTLTAGW